MLSGSGCRVLIGIAGLGLLGSSRLPAIGWIGLYTPALIGVYFLSMRLIFTHEQHRRSREIQEVAEELQYANIPLRTAALLYTGAAGDRPLIPHCHLARVRRRSNQTQLGGVWKRLSGNKLAHRATPSINPTELSEPSALSRQVWTCHEFAPRDFSERRESTSHCQSRPGTLITA